MFCKPVAVASAMVPRDRRAQAQGHPADHVRPAWPGSGYDASKWTHWDVRVRPNEAVIASGEWMP